MSKKVIGTLYTISFVLEMLVLSFMLVQLYDYSYGSYHSMAPTSGEVVFDLVAMFVGWVPGIIAWIGTLVNLGRARAWTWFILMFFFGGIVIFLYLINGPERDGQALSPQARSIIFTYGLIGGGILVGIVIIWYALNVVLDPILFPRLIAGDVLSEMNVLLFNIASVCLQVIAALPVFFWASKRASRRTGLAKAGRKVTLYAYGWWAMVKMIFFCLLCINLGFRSFSGTSLLVLALDIPTYILSFLFFLGAGSLMGWIGGRGYSVQYQPQIDMRVSNSQRYQSQPGNLPSNPQPYQPPRPVSSLEILQQRYARGEIDTATFDQIHERLKASEPPNA